MKSLVFLVIGLMSSVALATPGDVLCTGQLATGESIEVLLGYDAHGQDVPSLVEVSKDQQVVFTSDEVSGGMVNMGSDDMPFLNTVWVANDEESTATVRVPEQDPDADSLSVILTVLTDSGLFSVEELELECAY